MYIISPITVFDNDHELFETHVGRDLEGMPLDYSVWGETEEDSRNEAIALIDILNANQ